MNNQCEFDLEYLAVDAADVVEHDCAALVHLSELELMFVGGGSGNPSFK